MPRNISDQGDPASLYTCVEAFREPAVDRREQVSGFRALALIGPEPARLNPARNSKSLHYEPPPMLAVAFA